MQSTTHQILLANLSNQAQAHNTGLCAQVTLSSIQVTIEQAPLTGSQVFQTKHSRYKFDVISHSMPFMTALVQYQASGKMRIQV